MSDILQEIAANKRIEIEALKSQLPITTLEREIGSKRKHTFRRALEDTSAIQIIAEMKKGSPSRGLIAPDFDPITLAAQYHRGGAAALSILTESKYFYGRYEYIAPAAKSTGLPVLCKDFVVDPYQLFHAAYIGAAAVLIIIRLHSVPALRELVNLAEQLGLDCLVETHSEDEVAIALEIGATIIGVNNRNLSDFSIDLAVSERLASLIPDGIIKVSESGIFEAADIVRLRQFGYTRFLIGEALVRADDPSRLLQTLRSA